MDTHNWNGMEGGNDTQVELLGNKNGRILRIRDMVQGTDTLTRGRCRPCPCLCECHAMEDSDH